ncbi:MAG TPA: TolC family protein [Terriglobales bacterium]|nr:TolC family protein [Terriglobales bacterium]
MKRGGSILRVPRAVRRAFAVLIVLTGSVYAQFGTQPPPPTPVQGTSTLSQTTSTSSNTNGSVSSSATSAQDPFSGSVITEKATDQVITLSLKDAITRGLKANLGALLTEQGITSARAERWRALQAMLPDVTGRVAESVQQVNLAAEGIRFPGVPTIIGPFSNFDTRAYMTASAGLSQYQGIRSSIENLKAAQFSYQNALELVVFSVSNAYLQVLTAGANVVNAQAQVQTAQALTNQAEQLHQAGVSAKIDALRATVELQARKQDLIVAKNNLDKSRIALARTIGLPLEQKYELSDTLQFIPAPSMTEEEALHRAYQARLDYRQAQAQVRAAESSQRAAHFERLPSLSFNGNYGDIGITPGRSHGTFVAGGGIQFPIFEEGRIRSDIDQARAGLKQSKDRLSDLEGRIDAEIRTAFLDVNAAAEQVQVADATVKLSQEELSEARERFSAGVTDNLEVVQAQGSLVSAQNQYVSSLYVHNLAKLSLARALGEARQNAATYLGGK